MLFIKGRGQYATMPGYYGGRTKVQYPAHEQQISIKWPGDCGSDMILPFTGRAIIPASFQPASGTRALHFYYAMIS